MTLRQKFFIYSIPFLALIACSDSSEMPLQKFYYPITSFTDTTVYIYVEENTSDTKYDAFYYKPESQRLYQTSYAGDGSVTQKQQFQVYHDGVVLDAMMLYDTQFVYNKNYDDYVKEIEVISGQVYYYEKMDSTEKLNYHIAWTGEKPKPYKLDYIKNRYCVCDTLDDSSESLYMTIDGVIDDTRVGTLSLDYSGYEKYVSGKGLVAYQHAYSNGLVLTYNLYEVLTLEVAVKQYPQLKN